MHVDWNWIRQRPQALALALARSASVTVLYRANPHRGRLTRNPSPGLCLPLVPLPERIFGKFSQFIQKVHIALVWALTRPDVVWVTFPDLWPCLPQRLLAGRTVVYDCMDDPEAFFAHEAARAAVRAKERALLDRADLVLCSSRALEERARALKPRGEVLLVRNAGPDGPLPEAPPPAPEPVPGRLDLGYFGTVSDWMDWDLLDTVLDAAPDAHLHLVGPVERAPRAAHARLHFHGPVRREALMDEVAGVRAFVMPFRETPLVRAVDPVKLYEYLATGRPVFCPRYPEVERFGPLVHFYSTPGELLALVDRLRAGDPDLAPPWDAVRAFLAENSWSLRADGIVLALARRAEG